MSAEHVHLAERLIVKPGSKVHLRDADAGETHGYTKDSAAPKIAKDLERLTSLQERIWAQNRDSVLIVLQGIDAAGKDGSISHVMSAFNPQGCTVTGFGVPTAIEAAHDHLWRIHAAAPARRDIAIFNRSHYESVLVVRVHNLMPEARWRAAFDEINALESLIAGSGTTIIKCFLHISKAEQAARLKARYDDPTKHWKFNVGDLAERKLWDDYMTAYEDALTRCSTAAAPWYIIPADHKWFRNLALGEIVADRLEALKPEYPTIDLPKDLVIS
jgi:PPK2 family polyphosphate:nucleotide phosphotransferase